MKRECETCIKRKTLYCPASIDCMAADDMPYYQNRIMFLEENQELKKQLKDYQNLIKNLKQLELYVYDLDYDYEENPIDNYQPFDMDYYIDNYLKIEKIDREEIEGDK